MPSAERDGRWTRKKGRKGMGIETGARSGFAFAWKLPRAAQRAKAFWQRNRRWIVPMGILLVGIVCAWIALMAGVGK